jgi:DNA polymerase V
MKVYKIKNGKSKLEIFLPDIKTEVTLPLVGAKLKAGFPSPADDYVEERLDLNKHLIKNPESTFFARVSGESMVGAGIYDGDILVIDRSVQPHKNSVLVCAIDGEFTIKRIKIIDNNTIYLMPDNPDFEPIKVSRDNDLVIWGTVIYSIHKHY